MDRAFLKFYHSLHFGLRMILLFFLFLSVFRRIVISPLGIFNALMPSFSFDLDASLLKFPPFIRSN